MFKEKRKANVSYKSFAKLSIKSSFLNSKNIF